MRNNETISGHAEMAEDLESSEISPVQDVGRSATELGRSVLSRTLIYLNTDS